MQFTAETRVRAPQAEVYDAMADGRNETRWNSQVTESELVSGEPIGEGSLFRTTNRGQVYDARITMYDRPNRLGFEVTGKQLDITAAFAFTTRGEVTLVHERFTFKPKGVMKVFAPLFRPLIKRDLPKQAENFKRFCESR